MAANLRVVVKAGVVTLDGSVRNSTVRKAATDVASRVPGVLKVKNRLRIQGQ